MIVDTHTHIYDNEFEADFDSMLERAREAGVEKCVMPGIDSSYHCKMMECAGKLKGFAWPAIGLHPTSVADNWEDEMHFVEEHLHDGNFCAIGEIGLDGYWSREFMEQQKEVLYRQFLIAQQENLPVIIHLREATDDIYSVLERVRSDGIRPRGVFHAFTGSLETFERIQKYGDFKVGIGGVVTYKKASIADVLKDIPFESIVLETDSPWLTPVPFRGRRNEPSYIAYIVEKVAQVRGCSAEVVMEKTSVNAVELFNLH